MEYTVKSIKIPNLSIYTHRLEMDDIVGVIRLVKNKAKSDTTRITDRNIPITDQCHWKFYRERTGYSENNQPYSFLGSYISRERDSISYNRWKRFILCEYYKFKKEIT